MKKSCVVLAGILILSAANLGAQATCLQPFTLRQETCPGGPTTCLSKGSTLSFQELDRDLMNAISLCDTVGQFLWPEPARGELHSGPTGTVSIVQTVFNVVDYGADRTGAVDSTTAFNSAIAAAVAASGGVVYAPRGTYILTPASLSAIDTVGVEFRGDGPAGTRFQINDNGDIFRFGNVATPFGHCGGLYDLSIQGTTSRTGWIATVNGCYLGGIENVYTNLGGSGISFCETGGPCNLWFIEKVDMVDYGSSTVALKLSDGNDRFISNFSVRGADADRTGKTGILITESYGDWFTDVDVVLQDIGVHVVPDAGGVNWINMMDVLSDTNLNYGWLLTGSNPIRGWTCLSCWAGTNGRVWSGMGGSSTSRGFLIDNSSSASSYQFIGTRAFENGGIGFEVGSGVKNFSISGGWIQSSGMMAAGTLPGFKMSNSGSKVVGLRSGHAEGTGTGSQTYGIEVASGADDFLLIGNDVRQNVTGGILNSSGISNTKIVTGSLGNASGADRYALSSPTFITQTVDAGLTGEQALSALATGIVKNTTTTGVLSIAVAGDFPTLNQNTTGTAAGLSATLAVASGGTNLTSANDDAAMIGNGTTWQSKTVPDCTDSSGNHLNYTQSSNAFSCGTSISSSAAPSSAKYITQTAESGLSSEQALSALATGILKSTATTGVLSIAVVGDFPAEIIGWTDNGATVTATTTTDRIGAGGTPSTGHFYVTGAGTTSDDFTNGDADGATLYLQDSNNGAGNGGQLLIGAASGVFAGIKGHLNNGTGPEGFLEFQTRTISGNVTSKMEIRGNGHVVMKQNAPPSVSCTGTGTGATAAAVGNDNAFRVTISTGTTPTSSGTCTVTFAAAYSTTAPVMTCMLVSGATAWGIESVIQLTTESTSAPVLTWTNIAGLILTNLTGSSNYKFQCTSTGI